MQLCISFNQSKDSTMKAKLFFLIFCLMVFSNWAVGQNNTIKKAEWLIGTWENKTSQGSIYETWVKISDNELSGKSFALKEKDTIVFETIQLVQEQSGLFYIPAVKNQNNNKPVRFAVKTISDNKLVFENPQHDFPQIISYTKIGADSAVAEISGIKKGKESKQLFPMKRLKSSTMTTNKFDGTWMPIEQEIGGNPLPAVAFKDQKLIISDSTYTVIADNVDKGIVKYTGNKMDIYSEEGVNKGKHFTAIYKYENELLTICYNLQGDSYPETFDTKGKPLFFLSVFKKVK